MKKQVYKIGRERAVQLAINHNGVTREIAEKYTDSELREVVRHISKGARTFTFKCDF